MKMIRLSLFLLLTCQQVESQWVQASGPPGGSVDAIAVVGNEVFAGTPGGGIYKSSNNGIGWTSVNSGLTNYSVISLRAIDTIVLAGTTTGVYLSTDQGSNWSYANNGPTDVRAICTSGSYVYAGTGMNGVFLSTDRGLTWVPVNNGLTEPLMCCAVSSLATEGKFVYVGFWGAGVFYRSSDSGSTWTHPSNALAGMVGLTLSVIGSSLFAGTEGGGLFVSEDHGSSWSKLEGALDNVVTDCVWSFGTNLFAGTNAGLFVSTNGGTTWTGVDIGLPGVSVLTSGVSSENMIVGTNQGILVSTNAGTTWNNLQGVGSCLISNLHVDGTTLYAAAYENGAFSSSDGGRSWVSLGPHNKWVYDLAVSGSFLIAATDSGAYVTPTGSDDWTQPSPTLQNHAVIRLAVMSGYAFAGTVDGLFRSSDNGLTWSTANLGSRWIRSLSVGGMGIFAGSGFGGVFRSTDNGNNWADVSISGTVQNVFDIVQGNGSVYAATDGPPGVYRSVNEGASWVPAGPNLKYFGVNTLAQSGLDLFAGEEDAYVGGTVFLTTNYGVTWDSVAAGLPTPEVSNTGVNSLAVCGTDLFAGVGSTGVWRRPLSEMTSVITSQFGIPGSVSLEQNYPNPFNPSTTIRYELPHTAHVVLRVYNTLGQVVATLVDENKPAGIHNVQFDGSRLASGMYFYRLHAGDFVQTMRLMVLK